MKNFPCAFSCNDTSTEMIMLEQDILSTLSDFVEQIWLALNRKMIFTKLKTWAHEKIMNNIHRVFNSLRYFRKRV